MPESKPHCQICHQDDQPGSGHACGGTPHPCGPSCLPTPKTEAERMAEAMIQEMIDKEAWRDALVVNDFPYLKHLIATALTEKDAQIAALRGALERIVAVESKAFRIQSDEMRSIAKYALASPAEGEVRLAQKSLPCGCVTCICENCDNPNCCQPGTDGRCHGCGGKKCKSGCTQSRIASPAEPEPVRIKLCSLCRQVPAQICVACTTAEPVVDERRRLEQELVYSARDYFIKVQKGSEGIFEAMQRFKTAGEKLAALDLHKQGDPK